MHLNSCKPNGYFARKEAAYTSESEGGVTLAVGKGPTPAGAIKQQVQRQAKEQQQKRQVAGNAGSKAVVQEASASTAKSTSSISSSNATTCPCDSCGFALEASVRFCGMCGKGRSAVESA